MTLCEIMTSNRSHALNIKAHRNAVIDNNDYNTISS